MADGGNLLKEEKHTMEKDDTVTDLNAEEHEALDRFRAVEWPKKILELNRQEEEMHEEMSRLAVRPSHDGRTAREKR